jgi:rod shape-determining protein MreC
MASPLAERRPFLLLLVLLTFNLILMSSRVRGAGAAERSLLQEAVLTVVSPVLKVTSWTAGGAASLWLDYIDLRGVQEENVRLRDDLDRLGAKARESEEARLEAARLRDLLDLKQRVEYPTVPARVVGRDTSRMTVLLDRGTGYSLQVNNPVVTPRGVVGRIIEAASGISKVQTILDPNSGVAALIQRTRVQGIVVGEGERGLRMEYVSELASVEVGDVVVTSGLDRIYPKGYIIGVVTSIGEGEGLTKIVRMRPEADLRRLEEVLVLRNPEGGPGGEAP